MNEILEKRIEEAAEKYSKKFETWNIEDDTSIPREEGFKDGAAFVLQNQWISVGEGLPTEKQIIAKLSKDFCGKDDCIEILHRIAKEHIDLRHPDGYYDCCGENVPTSAITHWMPTPSLKGGEK